MLKDFQVWIGTSGWSYSHWAKTFYPPALKPQHWFEYYARHFNCVEINATFYRLFSDQTYQHWYDQAPDNFHYAVKASRFITHRKYLHEVSEAIHRCERSSLLLKNKLGVILVQLPANMPYDLSRLEEALKSFHHTHQVAVEFRHPRWLTPETKNLLTQLEVIFCDVDSPTMSLQHWLTSEIAYLRFHGRSKLYASSYSQSELLQVAEYIKKLSFKGVHQAYIFFNNDYQAHAVKNALTLKELVN